MDDEDDDWFGPVTAVPPPRIDCPDETAAYRLRNLMSDISERHYAAGWLFGLEYALFGAAFAGEGFGDGLSHEERAGLITLSHRCQGWWAYDDRKRFVPMGEWAETYARHIAERQKR